MLIWSHYKFRELLKNKGEMTGTKVIVGTEEYTSKTCGKCMYVNGDLKGARNILMHNWERGKMRINNIPMKLTILDR